MDVSSLLVQYSEGQRNFHGAALNSVSLYRAYLPFIVLDEASLQRADLRGANLAGGSLNHADLTAADLSRINLMGADLIRAKLSGANLEKALLSGANFSGANLRRVNLRDTSLAGADLSGADFSGAVLENTNLAGANLKGADFSHAKLSRLDLQGVDWDGAILSESQSTKLQAQSYLARLEASNQAWANQFGSELVEQPLLARPESELYGVPLLSPPAAETLEPTLAEAPGTSEVDPVVLGLPPTPLPEFLQVTRDSKDPKQLEQNNRLAGSIQSVLQRQVQQAFQQSLLEAYQYRCAITACQIHPLLEATFIAPESPASSDHPSSGLLLRIDIKALYKLRLLAIDPDNLTILLAPSLATSEYRSLQGKKIFLPEDKSKFPNLNLLNEHLLGCKWHDNPTEREADEGDETPQERISDRLSHMSQQILGQALSSIQFQLKNRKKKD